MAVMLAWAISSVMAALGSAMLMLLDERQLAYWQCFCAGTVLFVACLGLCLLCGRFGLQGLEEELMDTCAANLPTSPGLVI